MFSDINISQGSVATSLRSGGICNDFYCKFPIECNSETFEYWPIFGEIMDNRLVCCFLTHGVDISHPSTSP